jgi:tetratricopeptide (TPR) repeat protein
MRTVLFLPLLALAGSARADDPAPDTSKPPFERLLQGDEKAAAALQLKIASLEGADQYVEAARAAEELAALRARVQGADHWQARDAWLKVATLKTIGGLGNEERAEVRQADAVTRQADNLRAQGKHADAQPLYEKALAIYRKALGEEPTTKGHPILTPRLGTLRPSRCARRPWPSNARPSARNTLKPPQATTTWPTT